MHGNLMYEVGRQRLAERQRAARQAAEASEQRAAARGRRARAAKPEEIALPVIPDYAHELFDGAAGAAADGAARGRHERTGR
jgi:hypothetical protein